VINGRPAVWGDALPALCKASPVYDDIIETWEHEQDADLLTAVCIAKRHGSTPVTARFSVMDAKRAGLWTKAGPWQTYPRRMLLSRLSQQLFNGLVRECLTSLVAKAAILSFQPFRPLSATLDGTYRSCPHGIPLWRSCT
jgi:hypothetical protein